MFRLFAVLVFVLTTFGIAHAAQTPPLTSPQHRMVNTPDRAQASSEGTSANNALEPYLFVAILAGGGVLSFIVARVADARVRSGAW